MECLEITYFHASLLLSATKGIQGISQKFNLQTASSQNPDHVRNDLNLLSSSEQSSGSQEQGLVGQIDYATSHFHLAELLKN